MAAIVCGDKNLRTFKPFVFPQPWAKLILQLRGLFSGHLLSLPANLPQHTSAFQSNGVVWSAEQPEVTGPSVHGGLGMA